MSLVILSLCVPEVSPVHLHLCFPLAWFPVRLSQPGAEQRERVTHPSTQSWLCLAPAFSRSTAQKKG